MKIGFVGLGIMGAPMAVHLASAGYDLSVNTRSKVPDTVIAAGGRPVESAADVARNCDIVFLMLPDTPDVEKVLFAKGGIADGLKAGKIVVDMSSISPDATRTFAARIESMGCDYVDAPVSGGEVGAKAATLTIMVGCRTDVFATVEPLLALMGKNITHIGGTGAGQVAKVANQMIVALNIAAVAEALVFASKAGVDPARVREALMGGFAASRVLEVHGERMVKRTFEPGFRITLHQKDLGLALQSARTLGMALPQTAGTAQLMQAMQAQGLDQLDHSALVKALEMMACHEITSTQQHPD